MVIATDVQLALCKVLLHRVRGQSVCSFTFSVLLMMWEMFRAEHKRVSSPPTPMNAIHKTNQLGSHAHWKGGFSGSFCVSFSSACEYEWRRGKSLSYQPLQHKASWLHSGLWHAFFPTGKPNVLAQRDWLIAWLPKNLHPPPTTTSSPQIFKSSSSSVFFSIRVSQFVCWRIRMYYIGCWRKSKSIIDL